MRPETMEGAYLYILRCIDKSLYVGTTRDTLEVRVAQHNAGTFGGYTSTRRPTRLVYSEWFSNVTDTIAAERRLKK
jgi:putative endonuclease